MGSCSELEATGTGSSSERHHLTWAWIRRCADGYHVDRSTNTIISMMAHASFQSEEAARNAVCKAAMLQDIPEKEIVFLDGSLPLPALKL